MVLKGNLVSVCLLLLISHSATTIAEDGLVSNGDFEMAPTDEGVRDGPVSISDWKLNGTVEMIESGQRQGGMILIVPQGLRAVRLGNDAEISQELKLEKGSLYSVTFSAARTCAQLESLNISVPPASQTIDLQTLYSIQGWDTYAWSFQAESDNGRRVFRNPGMEDDPTCGPIIDDIAIKKLFTPDKPKGKRAIELLSGKEGIISQMVDTTPQKQYNLIFSLGQAGDKCQQPLAIMAFAGDQAQNIHYLPMANSTYDTANLTFTAKADRTRIAFYSVYYNTRTDDKSSLCGPVVDDVRVWGLSRSERNMCADLGLRLMLLILAFVLLWA
ncbi:hypothetical protein IFM89_013969 [Coptis chinensis]|uniref:DUF642 domain-containing protein n=1 Tax=Coptis chinensis TaxID=261450 RepID=A0A835INW4_9MAGN|nr:hypothetical protein IFM89_013969 [Coptis chinensis]